ncbi:MAG: hypothetical protein EBS89_08420 [Proteobacteria bacterium]|nr:hypothetical protein [Pseudomonadota bacterium]
MPAQTTNPVGDEFGLLTRPIVSSFPGAEANTYDDVTLVPTSSETTVVTYTVPVGKVFFFVGLNASGNANAIFKLYVDGSVVLAARTSVANLTATISYSHSPIKVAAGDTISIKVTHQAPVGCDFEGTILGYLL